MISLGAFIECFFVIQLLLIVSSFCVGSLWFSHLPSLKLRLARLLFLSCILAPPLVHFTKPTDKPVLAKFVSLDFLSKNIAPPAESPKKLDSNQIQLLNTPQINFTDLWLFIFILLFAGSLYRSVRLFKDFKKLKHLLKASLIYRKCGKLRVVISDQCHIPFSTRMWNTAYIVLPVSLLHSSTNIKIALAHEGQHHRQGDCLWSYYIEAIRIAFWINPSVHFWKRIFTELQELTCDEALVGHQMISAHDYGHCLYNIAQTASNHSKTYQQEFACTVGMAWDIGKHEKSFITRRICMLSKYQLHKPRRPFFAIVLTTVTIMGPLYAAYATKGSLINTQKNEIDISSLEPKIQEIANKEILAAVKKYRAKSGAIAIADPHTGKIIAFAESGSLKHSESWASRLFVPGSTIKPFVAAAAIDNGISTEQKIYDCHEPYEVDGKKFMNEDHNIGDSSLTNAMEKSINICFMKVAKELGPIKLREKLADFGFNIKNQEQISNNLQLATLAIGTTIPVNMETLTKAYAILANKGRTFPANSGSVISESTAASVTRMLVDTVEHGTGKRAGLLNTNVAGKTGTLAPDSNRDEQPSSHLALFGGYVPADAPRFVAFVVIEDGRSLRKNEFASGGLIAAPVFHSVAEKSLDIMMK